MARKHGFLRRATHLIHDRDPLFSKSWTTLLKTGGVRCAPIPAQSPNCNPHAERFVRTVRNECLDHFVIFGRRHLEHLVREFAAHYHEERYHQALGGRLIRPSLLVNPRIQTAQSNPALVSADCYISTIARPPDKPASDFLDHTGYGTAAARPALSIASPNAIDHRCGTSAHGDQLLSVLLPTARTLPS